MNPAIMTAMMMNNNSHHCNSTLPTENDIKLLFAAIILINVFCIVSYIRSLFYLKDYLCYCEMTNMIFIIVNGTTLFTYLVIKLAYLL
jgi:hypothetical protein